MGSFQHQDFHTSSLQIGADAITACNGSLDQTHQPPSIFFKSPIVPKIAAWTIQIFFYWTNKLQETYFHILNLQ